MKKLFYQLSVLLVGVLFVSCGTHKTIAYSKSEPVCIASELDGSYTLRVEGRGRNAVDAYEEAGKQAPRRRGSCIEKGRGPFVRAAIDIDKSDKENRL